MNEENLKEEFELDEETVEIVKDVIGVGVKFYNINKRRIFTRGLVIGALGAVAIQSIITVLVMLGN